MEKSQVYLDCFLLAKDLIIGKSADLPATSDQLQKIIDLAKLIITTIS